MATKQIAWNTGGGNITLTYTGQGNGTIDVVSDANNLSTERSQTITVKTTNGAIVKNLTVKQSACPVPVGTIFNYPYSGDVKEVILPAGRYKLQCWGAQGGTGGGYSGGKGGYSEGEVTLSKPTTLFIFVGGKGNSSGNGGWNGGGGGSGSASYNSGGIDGDSEMGCGGGATDIALVTSGMSYSSNRTNRSDASLLSRMIVAGGGGGGAWTSRTEPVSGTVSETPSWRRSGNTSTNNIVISITNGGFTAKKNVATPGTNIIFSLEKYSFPVRIQFDYSTSGGGVTAMNLNLYQDDNEQLTPWTADDKIVQMEGGSTSGHVDVTVTDSSRKYIGMYLNDMRVDQTLTVTNTVVSYTGSVPGTSTSNQAGYVGGGATGGGYNDSYKGKQNAAGTNGGFGYGANQTTTNYRHCSACGGGGWYGGGGGERSDDDINYIKRSGGGSGFVNTSANAGNRPSGYTGLQLDSGTTYDGNTSFEAVNGGRETGHSGDGYARITRIA